MVQLDKSGMVEEEDGSWVALVVLAAKTNQENVSCHKYQCIPLVSYQTLNQVTCPFAFPITQCDDLLQYIDKEANCFIALDMDSGYWEVVSEEEAQ